MGFYHSIGDFIARPLTRPRHEITPVIHPIDIPSGDIRAQVDFRDLQVDRRPQDVTEEAPHLFDCIYETGTRPEVFRREAHHRQTVQAPPREAQIDEVRGQQAPPLDVPLQPPYPSIHSIVPPDRTKGQPSTACPLRLGNTHSRAGYPPHAQQPSPKPSSSPLYFL